MNETGRPLGSASSCRRAWLSGLYAAARALELAYGAIRARGSTAHLGADPMTFDEFNETIGLERRYADGERYRFTQ